MTAFLDCFGERQQYWCPCADIFSKSYQAILKSYAQGGLIRGKQTFLTD